MDPLYWCTFDIYFTVCSRTTTDCAYEDRPTPLSGSQPAAHHESECGTPCWMLQSYVLNINKNLLSVLQLVLVLNVLNKYKLVFLLCKIILFFIYYFQTWADLCTHVINVRHLTNTYKRGFVRINSNSHQQPLVLSYYRNVTKHLWREPQIIKFENYFHIWINIDYICERTLSTMSRVTLPCASYRLQFTMSTSLCCYAFRAEFH